jgi:peroxygenase
MTRSIARLGLLSGLLSALLLAGCGAQPGGAPGAALPGGAIGAASKGHAIANPSVLQKHLMFFDRDNDGILTVEETKGGLQRLGLNPLGSLGGAVFIHAGLRKAGGGGSTIDIAKIQLAKHKSDTGAFDAEGRFVPEAFERMWRFDRNHSGSLSWAELSAMIAANKQDTAGSLASKAEFGLLIKLAADTSEGEAKTPAISRERLRSVYTGTIFYDVAAEREQHQAKAIEGALPE